MLSHGPIHRETTADTDPESLRSLQNRTGAAAILWLIENAIDSQICHSAPGHYPQSPLRVEADEQSPSLSAARVLLVSELLDSTW